MTRNQKLKYHGVRLLGGSALALPLLANAQATDPGTTIFAAIVFTSIAAAVVGVAVVSMGISTAFKAWGLGKKAVNRV